jgi:hypothetical protein
MKRQEAQSEYGIDKIDNYINHIENMIIFVA